MTSYWSQNKVQTPLAHEQFPSGSGPCLPLFYLICMLHSCRTQLWACSLMICPLRFPPSEILLCSLLCLAKAYMIFKTWLKHHLLLEAFHDPSHLQTETGPHLCTTEETSAYIWPYVRASPSSCLKIFECRVCFSPQCSQCLASFLDLKD